MKKLMIATAAVAMASSVLAEGYNFTATLKTTSARVGTAVIETLNLGWNGVNFWYEDVSVDPTVNLPDGTTEFDIPVGYFKMHNVLGSDVPAFRKTATNGGTVEDTTGRHPLFLLDLQDGNFERVIAQARILAARYPQRSPGFPVFCDSIRVVNPALCYRIAGTKRIDVRFRDAVDIIDCCKDFTDMGWAANEQIRKTQEWVVFDNTATALAEGLAAPTKIAYYLNQTDVFPQVNSTLFQRFGGQTSATARSVEMFARVPVSVTTDGDIFAGWIAGQGTVLTAPGVGNEMYSRMVMGNIVGVLTAPVCPSCCKVAEPSVAFDCANILAPAQLPLTAAYGTFQLMYNQTL